MARAYGMAVVALLLAACTSTPPAGSVPGEAGAGGGGGGTGGLGGTGGSGGFGGFGGSGGTGGSGGVDSCGNGRVDPGEACDDGNRVDDDCCTNRCAEAVCGDGITGCGEACDDGNARAGDGCSAVCTRESVECIRDQDCDGDRGEICVRDDPQVTRGVCTIDGHWCATDAACLALEPARCPTTESCYCRTAAGDGEDHGVCWQRVGACGSCETDAECGSSATFARPADCRTYHYQGTGDRNVCLPRNLPGQACPPGFVEGGPDDGGLDRTGSCVPLPHHCPFEPCQEDADCHDPANPTCDVASGVCMLGCSVDAEGKTVGCSAEKPACHARPERLDPTLPSDCATAPMYGYGTCGIECRTDADCEHRGNDVNGEPYVCREQGGKLSCWPRGCVSDGECPPAEGATPGFCDPTTQACVYDRCRLGSDPRAGCGVEESFRDCAAGYLCVPDASGRDTGTCEPVTP